MIIRFVMYSYKDMFEVYLWIRKLLFILRVWQVVMVVVVMVSERIF